jgi:subtilisin family serine protease
LATFEHDDRYADVGHQHDIEALESATGAIQGVLDPATSTTGSEVSPATLRQTLGVGSTWTGRGVGVAVIDSGLEMSSEFTGRVAAFYNFVGGRPRPTSPSDEYGHGTHIAGTIAGSGALSVNNDYRGLAPKVTLTILKVLMATAPDTRATSSGRSSLPSPTA